MTTGILNAREVSIDLARFVKEATEETLVTFQRSLVLRFLRGVVLKTPVKSGRARGGWQVAIDEPTEEERPEDKEGGTTIATGFAAVGGLKPFVVVYITNPVVYIIPLEEGHSQQAPNGMAELRLNEVLMPFLGS